MRSYEKPFQARPRYFRIFGGDTLNLDPKLDSKQSDDRKVRHEIITVQSDCI